METIVLNSSNLTNLGAGNNQFRYKFPSSVTFSNNQIAVSSVSLYYSWYNISSQLGNNNFTYTWTSGTTTTIYQVIIPDGIYEITSLNEFLQYVMIQNGTYLLFTDSNTYIQANKYYVEFIVSPTSYAIQLNTFLVPTNLSTGLTTPANFAGFPTTSQNPVVTLPAKINAIFGFKAGFTTDTNLNNTASYPLPLSKSLVCKTSDGTITYISTTAPNLAPNSNLLFTLTNTQNKYSNPSNMLFALTPTCNIGQQFASNPPKYNWTALIDGTINEIVLTIISATDFMPVYIQDPNTLIVLVVRQNPIAKPQVPPPVPVSNAPIPLLNLPIQHSPPTFFDPTTITGKKKQGGMR